MREIIMQLSENYAMYRGYGKLAVLFFAAIICLIFIYKENRGRIHPLLFVMSIYTGIATALVKLIEKAFTQKDSKKICGIIATVFALFAITLSGSRIYSSDFIAGKDEVKTEKANFEAAAAYLTGLEESPKVLADYDVMSGLLCYSSAINPMYKLNKKVDEEKLSLDERKLYEAISDHHPPMEMITRLAGKEGHYYVVVDNTYTWPEKPVEGMYSLINTIGSIDIYEYGGNAYE